MGLFKSWSKFFFQIVDSLHHFLFMSQIRSISFKQKVEHKWIWFSFDWRTTIEVDELENNMSSKLVTIVLPNDNQSVSEEALTLTVKLDHEETSLLSTLWNTQLSVQFPVISFHQDVFIAGPYSINRNISVAFDCLFGRIRVLPFGCSLRCGPLSRLRSKERIDDRFLEERLLEQPPG